jgi:ATP-dependent protease ClpP protease subunit
MLSGDVGPDGFAAHHLWQALEALGSYDLLDAELDSPGGAIYDAWFIYNYLKRLSSKIETRVLITGQASSAAVLLAIGFHRIAMKRSAMMRFHRMKATTELRGHRTTGAMAAIIAQHTCIYFDEVVGWMDEERQFTATEFLERRLFDRIV